MLNSVLIREFQKQWERHPNKDFVAHNIDPDKLREVTRLIADEELWDCSYCTFVGYILIRCKQHWSEAWVKTL